MRTKLILLTFLAICFISKAQNKIAIVNNADTNLYFQYIGFGLSGNSEESIPCSFNVAAYTEDRLNAVLRNKFDVTKLLMPSELEGGSAIRSWVESLIGEYEKVVVISSRPYVEYYQYTPLFELYGSGLISRKGMRTEVYSTIYIDIYNTYNGKSIVPFDLQVWKKVYGYANADNKRVFNPEMCYFISTEVKKFIKENLQYSLEFLKIYSKNELIAILNYEALNPTPQIELAYEQNISDSILVTGWYYTTDKNKGFKRKLDKSEEEYFIDPMPIAIKDNFKSFEIYQTDFKGKRPDIAGLNIILDEYGRTAFASATLKLYDRHIALVVNNKLVNALLVKTVLNDGITYLQRKEYNISDIEALAKEIEDNGH